MDIEYVFGAKSEAGNSLFMAVKLFGESNVRASLIVNGVDGHARVTLAEAKRDCFDLVYRRGWDWITEDDVYDLCHVRKRPLYGRITACNRFARIMVPILFIGMIAILLKKL